LVPQYDIFAGRYGDPDVRWIQAVEGLGAACEQMHGIAKTKRGPYFVFDVRSRAVLASVDTTVLNEQAAESG